MSSISHTGADLLPRIREAIAQSGLLFTIHAVQRATERSLPVGWAREAIASAEAEVIENYPTDARGPSCLSYGRTNAGVIVHVQVSHPPVIAVITVYEPDPARWQPNLKTRK